MAENMADLCKVSGFVRNRERDVEMPLAQMGTGMRCIYILSLLEAYIYGGKTDSMHYSHGGPGNLPASETPKGCRGNFVSAVKDESGHFYDPFSEYAL